MEVFRNALCDIKLIQKLLEGNPQTLNEANEIVHRQEVLDNTAASVTNLMKAGRRVQFETRSLREQSPSRKLDLENSKESELCRLMEENMRLQRELSQVRDGGPSGSHAGPSGSYEGPSGSYGHFYHLIGQLRIFVINNCLHK